MYAIALFILRILKFVDVLYKVKYVVLVLWLFLECWHLSHIVCPRESLKVAMRHWQLNYYSIHNVYLKVFGFGPHCLQDTASSWKGGDCFAVKPKLWLMDLWHSLWPQCQSCCCLETLLPWRIQGLVGCGLWGTSPWIYRFVICSFLRNRFTGT